MITEYAAEVATRMGMKLSKVSLIEGRTVGCLDTHSLMMSSNGCNVSTIIYQADLEKLENRIECDRLELRIQQALTRLQFMLEL
ncbi:MAG: hypothetical protein WC007_16185 [Pelobacteraceae bacterium]